MSIVTHLVAFAAGALGSRALVVRRLKVVEHSGHLAVTVRNDSDTD